MEERDRNYIELHFYSTYRLLNLVQYTLDAIHVVGYSDITHVKQAYAQKHPAESQTLPEVHSKERSYTCIDMDENHGMWSRGLKRFIFSETSNFAL